MICKQIARQTHKEQPWPFSSTGWDAYEENESVIKKKKWEKDVRPFAFRFRISEGIFPTWNKFTKGKHPQKKLGHKSM